MKAITRLKESIEKHLNWGEAADWTNYDFEKLSDDILKATGVNLSVSTLKRFFGKVKYGSSPSVTTLNTLSRFLNFEDWRAFEAAQKEKLSHEEMKPAETVEPEKPENKNFQLKPYLYSSLALLIAIATFIFFRSKPKYNPSDFKFSSKTIMTSGVPNSVVFDYDASKVDEDDSVFISQNWDISRKVQVDRNGKNHSSIYYYPGFFRAKLMAGDYILKEHDIQITTDGWMGILAAPQGERPLYFTNDELYDGSEIRTTAELFEKYKIDLSPELPEIWFTNLKDIEGFRTDNFEFETEVKSTFSAGKGACQRVQVLLQGQDDILIAPLAQKACVGDLYLAAYGFGVHSSSADLSAFGTDMNEWTKLRIKCVNRKIDFFVNDSLAYEAETTNPVNDIVGVHVRFEGPGSVRNTVLKSGEKTCRFD